MKPLITAIVFHFAFFVTLHTYAQPGTWTWVKGDSVQSVGRFGIKGVPDPANEPPSRYACAFWTDTANNFWVFGGVNDWYSTGWLLNDLWKFDPLTQNWTWMQGDVYQDSLYYPVYAAPKGVFSPLNKPGGDGFGIFTWVTPDNHLWMYGGYRSHMFGCRLWQYDPAINQWAWMTDSTGYAANHGTLGVPSPTNSPGQRYENNTCWVDSVGDLWMYGGAYIFSINMNLYKDMWKYTRSTGLWTWMSGSNVSNSLPGSLGTIGVPSVNNYPPGRMSNFFWKENNGNFRMSGGGRSSTSVGGVSSFRQDDWRFNPTTLEWTRLNGAGTFDNSPEAWVNHCDTSEENQEGATYENRAVWKICDDIVMNYNGGIDSFSNSLWAYVTTTHQWIKIGEALYPGRRGTKGVASPLNFPTHRLGPASFKDKQGNLWLFGGWSPIFVTTPYFNDMWKYEVDSSCFRNFGCLSPTACQPYAVSLTTGNTSICSSDSSEICAPAGYNSYLWNNGKTSRCIYTSLAGNYYVTVTDGSGCPAVSSPVAITVFPQPPVSISVNIDTLKAYDAVTYQWYFNGSPIEGATDSMLIVKSNGNYSVVVTDENGCRAVSNPVTYAATGIDQLSSTGIRVYPNPNNSNIWQLQLSNEWLNSDIEITDATGRLVFKAPINTPQTEIMFDAARGIYMLSVRNAGQVATIKLLKI